MKKRAALALLLSGILLAGSMLTGCKDKGKNDKGDGQQIASSSPSSEQTSSKANDLFPESSEPEVSLPTSSEEDAPANATPQAIEIDGITLSDVDQLDNTKVTWGPGHAMDENNRSTACVGLQEKYGKYNAKFIMPMDEKTIYLTFDEGYENGYTEKILDVLKDKDCQATFYVTLPYVKQNPELIQRMIDEGHVVGNHSVTHPEKGEPSLSTEKVVEDIAGLHNYMVENFNYQMTTFRPPAGLFSERTLEITKELGYNSALWSFGYLDYLPKAQPDPEEAFEKVTGAAHPGAIYLLHAVSKTNTEILGRVIDELRGQGYAFEPMR